MKETAIWKGSHNPALQVVVINHGSPSRGMIRSSKSLGLKFPRGSAKGSTESRPFLVIALLLPLLFELPVEVARGSRGGGFGGRFFLLFFSVEIR